MLTANTLLARPLDEAAKKNPDEPLYALLGAVLDHESNRPDEAEIKIDRARTLDPEINADPAAWLRAKFEQSGVTLTPDQLKNLVSRLGLEKP